MFVAGSEHFFNWLTLAKKATKREGRTAEEFGLEKQIFEEIISWLTYGGHGWWLLITFELTDSRDITRKAFEYGKS